MATKMVIANSPKWVQDLPKEARNAWIKSYNAAVAAEYEEVAARRWATNNIKNIGFTKQEDGTWAKDPNATEMTYAKPKPKKAKMKPADNTHNSEDADNPPNSQQDPELEEDTFEPDDPPLDYRLEAIHTAIYRYYDQYDAVARSYPNWHSVGIWDDYFICFVDGKYWMHGYSWDEEDGLVIDWEAGKEVAMSFTTKGSEQLAKLKALAGVQIAESAVAAFRIIAEETNIREAKVGDGDIVENVILISPGWSLNGRYYPSDVLSQSAPMWEAARAYGDHKDDNSARSIFEQVGFYKGVHSDAQGRLVADMHLVGASEKKEHIKDWVKACVTENQTFMGLSIVAIAETIEGTVEGRKGIIVSSIVRPKSVDVVTDPAAGGGFELVAAGLEDKDLINAVLKDIPYAQWKESAPEHVAKLREELKEVRQDSAVKDLTEQVTALQAEKTALTESQSQIQSSFNAAKKLLANSIRDRMADELLGESNLPKVVHQDVLTRLREVDSSLEESGVREAMQTIINAETARISRLGIQIKIEGIGQTTPTEPAVASPRKTGVINPLPGETGMQYRERMLKAQEAASK